MSLPAGTPSTDAGLHLEGLGDALLRDMPDALVVCDADGTIRFWNAGAERLFGHPAAEAVGRSLDIVIPERLRARHWSGYRETMRTGRSRYGAADLLSVPAIRRDGRRISVQFSIMVLRDARQRVCGVAAILRDITEAYEQRRDLERQLADLRSAAVRASAPPCP